MHDGMPYGPVQGQGHVALKVRNSSIFRIYLVRHFQWKLANDADFLTRGQYLNLTGPDFWCFLVFVSRDFELGRTWLAGGVDRQSRTWLIFRFLTSGDIDLWPFEMKIDTPLTRALGTFIPILTFLRFSLFLSYDLQARTWQVDGQARCCAAYSLDGRVVNWLSVSLLSYHCVFPVSVVSSHIC